MRLVEVTLPWVRTMDQDTSNHNASHDESWDPHRMRIGKVDTSSTNTHVPAVLG